jgi:hypothetical protein
MMKSRVKKMYLSVKNLWSAKPLFAAVVVFFIVFSAYAIIYIPSKGISAVDDHFFYFRYASLLKDKGWEVVDNFPWLYYSKVTQEHSRYPVALFNFAVIPFTLIKNPILGLKISDIFWASLACSAFYYLLRKIRIKWALFYVLILLSFPFFASRILMGRAFILTPVLIFWELYLANRKKYKILFAVSLFHILWHPLTFFMPVATVGLVEISRYIVKQKFVFKNIFVTGIGTVVGMSFFPDFPKNIWLWIKTILIASGSIAGVPNMDKVEGSELSPVSLLSFWPRSDMAIFILMLSVAVFMYFYLKDRKFNFFKGTQDNFGNWRIYTYSSFLLAFILFSFSILFSGRFLDFYFVSAVFLLALVLQRIFAEEDVIINSQLRKYIFFGVIVFFVTAFLSTFSSIKENTRRNDYEGIKESSEWIKERSSQGDIVFLFDWDNFPMSFFYNQKNNYTMGIEPKILMEYNSSLYWKWHNIFLYNFYCGLPKDCSEEEGALIKSFDNNQEKIDEFTKENSKKIIYSIKNDFKSRFIISNSSQFNSVLRQNPDLIDDSFSHVSELNGGVVSAFKIK